MRKLIVLALVAGASLAHAQGSSKKELVARLLQLQQPSIEALARNIVERPAVQMMQSAGAAMQAQVPPSKRDAVAKSVDADIRKFVDEASPLLAERAVKLAPSVYGVQMEERFSEDELKQLIAWLESPVNKKFQQQLPELQNGFAQKLIGEAGPLLEPRLKTLQGKLQATLNAAAAPAAAASAPKGAPSPAKAASK
ncbi:MAG: DUF2059 domain-containing protein [Piscinibacter sp.]|uniref:DUF2059 domain-containing protein n=1 Tax=Piscinibacter sp. TaxID=1903157 RepID=UPI001B6AF963|nr:DUF2059 domain-containing protein [Piscinibacter sp.]MBP5989068.1 DUF2059 domain-containing protein [Piscinibacter sp.]MBP6026212.1 DUF2059 domain-containing protein [Piscinibacter sp.]